jgi:hypothetical protein
VSRNGVLLAQLCGRITLAIDNKGRVMLPSWRRKKMTIAASRELRAVVTDDRALTLEARDQDLRRAQALLRKYIPEGVNLSEELVADRRREAASEFRKL